MSYTLAETSTSSGHKVRLYQFTRAGAAWRYSSGDTNLVWGGVTWLSLSIQDDGLRQKGEAVTDDFIMTVPSAIPIVQMFKGSPPSQPIRVCVREKQFDGADAPIVWIGYVSSVKNKSAVASDIVANTQTAFLNRRGLRLAWSRACPHSLYDTGCKVDKTLWAEPATVSGLTGNGFGYTLLTDPGRWSARFTDGFVEWGVDGLYWERRAIEKDFDTSCLVIGTTDGMSNGMAVNLYPGCQRIPSACQLFNNISNYGGFPFLPGRSPFDGQPVF